MLSIPILELSSGPDWVSVVLSLSCWYMQVYPCNWKCVTCIRFSVSCSSSVVARQTFYNFSRLLCRYTYITLADAVQMLLGVGNENKWGRVYVYSFVRLLPNIKNSRPPMGQFYASCPVAWPAVLYTTAGRQHILSLSLTVIYWSHTRGRSSSGTSEVSISLILLPSTTCTFKTPGS